MVFVIADSPLLCMSWTDAGYFQERTVLHCLALGFLCPRLLPRPAGYLSNAVGPGKMKQTVIIRQG